MEMLASFLSKSPEIKIILEKERFKKSYINNRGEKIEYPTYYDNDTIKGKVLIELNKNKNFLHNGLKIELIGIIENYKDRKLNTRFISLTHDLSSPGHLDNELSNYDFEFVNVEKPYETYHGKNVKVSYYLQTTLTSKYKNIINEAEFVILKPKNILENEIHELRIDVGIEEWIHVSFELQKNIYHLRDIIIGEVLFKKISLRLQSMELQLIKKETTFGLGN